MEKTKVNMRFRARQKAAGFPRAEVGEIDTRAPFESVKAAVSLFGEVAFSKEKPIIKKSKPPTEGALDKEMQLLLAQKELIKLKERMNNAETTKVRALSDLEKAKITLHELTHKLKSVSESKQSAIEAKQVEVAKSRKRIGSGGTWKQDLDWANELYIATITELDDAKQELRKTRQDFDAALEAKMVAFKGAADAQYATKVNTEKLIEISKEIKILSERSKAARASSDDKIKLSAEEFESFRRKVEESKNLAEMKLGAAKAKVEAINASKNEADKRIEANLKEIEDMKAETETVLKKAEMAESAKKAVEGLLRKWRQEEQKKAAEVASHFLEDTQPQRCHQKHPDGVPKMVEEKNIHFRKRRFWIISVISSIGR